jgi:hypothetical protein
VATDKLTLKVLGHGVRLLGTVVKKHCHLSEEIEELEALRKALKNHITEQKKQHSQWDGTFEYDREKRKYIKHYINIPKS